VSKNKTFPTVPLREVPAQAGGDRAEAHRPVVLVVDDESVIADTLAEILSRSGYHAVPVYDGDSALETALLTPPEMLITDVVLPGMTGIELAITSVDGRSAGKRACRGASLHIAEQAIASAGSACACVGRAEAPKSCAGGSEVDSEPRVSSQVSKKGDLEHPNESTIDIRFCENRMGAHGGAQFTSAKETFSSPARRDSGLCFS
jgi:hypothetical protein